MGAREVKTLAKFKRKLAKQNKRAEREGWKSVYPVKRMAPPLGSVAKILPFKSNGVQS
jgi:hypothetical protein